MENSKFQRLIEKAIKDKMFGNDEHEYMQYHPENIRGDVLGVTRAKLSHEQIKQLEQIWKIKRKEYFDVKEKVKKDSDELQKFLKPIYWVVGIFILMAILFGPDYGSGPGEFHDALRPDDAKR